MYGDFKANNYFSLIISCEHIWTNVGNSSKDNNNNDDGLQFFLVFLLRTRIIQTLIILGMDHMCGKLNVSC